MPASPDKNAQGHDPHALLMLTALFYELLDEEIAAGELCRIVKSVRQTVKEKDLPQNPVLDALASDLAHKLLEKMP